MTPRVGWPWPLLFLASGAVGLAYELVWMRRLGLLLGGSAPAAAWTVGGFMGGLALGAVLARRLNGSPRAWYARMEAAAALWAVLFPTLLAAGRAATLSTPALRPVVAVALLLPPTIALGATWPLVASRADGRLSTALYAANTAGAVLGVLLTAFVGIPLLGVRGAELAAAGAGLAVAAAALWWLEDLPEPEPAPPATLPPRRIVLAAGVAGFAALGLELVWFRLAAVALGATVQVHALVLATFLATVAAGALVGRRWPRDPVTGLAGGLAGVGLLAVLGAALWGQIPYGVALLFAWGGPPALLPGATVLAVLAMGGAPAASGVAFSCGVRALGADLRTAAGPLLAANTLGSIMGAWLGGLWAVPVLELHGAVALFALSAAGAGALVARGPVLRWAPLAAVAALAVVVPGEDKRLFAVGVHHRISDFADPSIDAVRRFADEGWELLSYDHGTTGAVAVGRSTVTGNVWLSIDGKVDASTGDDMPTQQLSGILPVRMAQHAENVLVVGLASGVTAGSVLAEPGVAHLTVVELEPAVVRASHAFDHVNGRPLDDPRTTLVVDDARAFLDRPGPLFDVIVSEPSNPWISGVSNLFTLEYWQAARARLAPDGVMCQWVQLYGLGPEELRALVRTFQHVFPDAWLFETIPGSDALLVGGAARLPDDLPLSPTLDPAGVRRLGGAGWLNTDDRPRVEWQAPGWLHYATAAANEAILTEAAR